MNINDLKPASQIAKQSGVKALVYGPARVGKTRLVLTAPSPIMLDAEKGTGSLGDEGDSIPCWEANTVAGIDDFFKWLFSSKEVKKFDTIFIDSMSRITEIYLRHEIEVVKHKDDRQAYGEMARKVYNIAMGLLVMDNINVCLICKEKEGDDRVKKTKPYFEGNALDSKIPYDYNHIFRLDFYRFPGVKEKVLALLTEGTTNILAGHRYGDLYEYEEPNLTTLFEKCMS